MFELLSDADRRIALRYLEDRRGDRVEIDDLLEEISAARASVEPDALETRLYHSHLPKLAATGVVEYDERGETVRYVGDPLVESGLRIGDQADTGRPRNRKSP